MRAASRVKWRHLVPILGVLAALPVARADEVPAPLPVQDRAAIRSVIQHQIEAFRHDDGAAAFGDASPGIRQMFGDAGTFMEMVRRGYAPVYHPQAFAFGPLTDAGGKIVQHVELTGPDGARQEALYFMEREGDGTWRIDGCELTTPAAVGA